MYFERHINHLVNKKNSHGTEFALVITNGFEGDLSRMGVGASE